MKTIYKYRVSYPHINFGCGSNDIVEIDLPKDCVIRQYGIDGTGEICIWAEFEEGIRKSTRRYFTIYGTGFSIPDNSTYIGSTITPQGYVWHLYERFVG